MAEIIIRKRKSRDLVITDDIKNIILHTTIPRPSTIRCINLGAHDQIEQRHMKVTPKHKVLLV